MNCLQGTARPPTNPDKHKDKKAAEVSVLQSTISPALCHPRACGVPARSWYQSFSMNLAKRSRAHIRILRQKARRTSRMVTCWPKRLDRLVLLSTLTYTTYGSLLNIVNLLCDLCRLEFLIRETTQLQWTSCPPPY